MGTEVILSLDIQCGALRLECGKDCLEGSAGSLGVQTQDEGRWGYLQELPENPL